jgi:hypothetical protein
LFGPEESKYVQASASKLQFNHNTRRPCKVTKISLETSVQSLQSTPDMRTNPLGPFLAGVFVACALVVAWLSAKYFFSVKEFQKLSARAATINSTRNTVQSLANEAVEYSRRNPAIDPLLERFDIKARTTNPAVATPPGTPAPK